ncbi:zinc-dependent alcohol dehydrogenase family protein [Pseudomonas sp. UL073]|uniref:Zinc-dependent alcohol dehydrogenase family protein n=1 Tax=Zestomonas insulae TaxID=2809017 RepID=A0ABS2I7P0_9GAMM|nr:zinc-dependent alcohol dehydrogenase family protein [Pseudomonas insulae]MBM7059164.1 zinc-dependent alcohol dehydrogenase family protein [Pseudomonas insulae]
MSRMIRFHQFGPAEVLKIEQADVAQPGPGEVLLRAEAIGVSWFDVLWRQNLSPCQTRLPAGIGHEVAGEVLAVGSDVTDFAVGDKVASFMAHSPNEYPAYGEQVLLPRGSLVRYPEQLSAAQASVHYTALLTGYFAYVDLAHIQPGQSVLLTDAAHCNGPAMVQLGKALGATVYAATKDAEDREFLLGLGADKVIVTEEEDLVGRIAKFTNERGVDVVLDGLGGPQMCLLGDVLAPRGRLILYGLQGGNDTPFPACAAFQKNIQFFVHCLGNFTGKPDLNIPQDEVALQRALTAINQMTRDGLLQTQIGKTYPFASVVEAHRYMESCPKDGRVVLFP